MNKHTFLFITLLLLCVAAVYAEKTADGPYTPDWQSLQAHTQAPEWFRDAKFGIYFHWGVYSVPAFGNEWYPRNMHIKKSAECRHHTETYGDPSVFGYHDFVPMFKAENFDADAWADLFVKAGAQFMGPVAEHHDGFSMWDSALTPWNAADKGPKRDIAGELAKAARARGLRFVTSFHHARNNQHLINKNGELVWEGHYPRVDGWPTLSADPELCMLYGNLPRLEFCDLWLGKLQEVIDQYQPDLIWFDSWLDEIPETYQMKFLAYYLNRAKEWNKDVVITCKQRDLPLEVVLEDFEKGRADTMLDEPWLTDDTLSYGSWCYTENLKIKPADEVLDVLIDIVSKNGQLLLNISPMADGTIPQDQQDVLLAIGKWLDAYGEAIYGTRPFVVYGEGPTQMKKGGHFVGIVRYKHEDIRYTRNGDTVYAILLGQPDAAERIELTAFGKDGKDRAAIPVTNVSLLGSSAPITWKQMNTALFIECPDVPMDDMAVVFKIETRQQYWDERNRRLSYFHYLLGREIPEETINTYIEKISGLHVHSISTHGEGRSYFKFTINRKTFDEILAEVKNLESTFRLSEKTTINPDTIPVCLTSAAGKGQLDAIKRNKIPEYVSWSDSDKTSPLSWWDPDQCSATKLVSWERSNNPYGPGAFVELKACPCNRDNLIVFGHID